MPRPSASVLLPILPGVVCRTAGVLQEAFDPRLLDGSGALLTPDQLAATVESQGAKCVINVTE